MTNYIQPLLGGLLIGLAVTIMLLFNGRVIGISGIIAGLIKPAKNETFWRFNFILGLLVGGLLLKFFSPAVFENTLHISTYQIVAAGLLVGFGTLLGNGCTSGHGVCGISRLSLRSMIATAAFMASGILVVFILRKFGFLL